MAKKETTEDKASRYMKRSTKDTTVHEIFEVFAPVRADQTSAHLVSFGPQHYFIVVQGSQAETLTHHLLNGIEAFHEVASSG